MAIANRFLSALPGAHMPSALPLPPEWGSLWRTAAPVHDKEGQHKIAHALLRSCLGDISEEELMYGDFGKPYLSCHGDVFFNLSHCDGMAVCFLADRECGVDAEKIRTVREAVVRKVFSPEERETLLSAEDPDYMFTRLWTLKEAYVKAIGRGLSYHMGEVCFSLKNEKVCSNVSDAAFAQILLPEHVVSACVLKTMETNPVISLR